LSPRADDGAAGACGLVCLPAVTSCAEAGDVGLTDPPPLIFKASPFDELSTQSALCDGPFLHDLVNGKARAEL
jgi:hypothetical protein